MSIYEGITPGDFAKSTRKRLPICFCLDASGSMEAPTESGRTRMEELNEAFNTFISVMKQNEDVAASADIAIIKFGGEAELTLPFKPIKNFDTVTLTANHRSYTPIGDAIKVALKLLDVRKSAYKKRGIKYYQPWLVVLTDGEPEGEGAVESMEEAIASTIELERNNKIVVFNIGIGDEVNVETLGRLSEKRRTPICVSTTNLNELFAFLGSSSESVISGTSDNVEDVLYIDPSQVMGERFDMEAFNKASGGSVAPVPATTWPTPEPAPVPVPSPDPVPVLGTEPTPVPYGNNPQGDADTNSDIDISKWCI